MNRTVSSRQALWAPWWAYTLPIGALNLLRQLAFPPSRVGDGVSIALFAGTVTAVVVAVTALHRLVRV
jgi:hypothetical protein